MPIGASPEEAGRAALPAHLTTSSSNLSGVTSGTPAADPTDRTATVGDVVRAADELYLPAWAEPGDPIGLQVGDPQAEVRRVLLAVDVVPAVVAEARRAGAGLIVAHHPLLFRAVHSVAATTPKGALVHALASGGVGLFVAHTNADVAPAPRGVSAALADALGVRQTRPLISMPTDPLDKIVTFVPAADAEAMIDALAAAGAGAIGDYDRCAFVTAGEGTFRPLDGAHPAIGEVGRIEVVDERRVEMVLPRARRTDVVAALRAAHPYEEPAFDVFELASWGSERGLGRIGVLPQPTTLAAFSAHVVRTLPQTAVGARVAGDLDRLVETVAVVGGAGDSTLDAARAAGADVLVTSDLRHHPALEAQLETGAPALVDVPHWAAEWPWLPVAAAALTERLAGWGLTVDAVVSAQRSDPWTLGLAPVPPPEAYAAPAPSASPADRRSQP